MYLIALLLALAASFRNGYAQGGSCQKGFTLFDADSNTALTHFPSHDGYAYGEIDLFGLSKVRLSLGVEFCNSSIKSVEFVGINDATSSYVIRFRDGNAPFAVGDNTSSSTGAFLHAEGQYFIETTGYSNSNAKGSFLDSLVLSLTVLAPFRFTLVDTNTDTDVMSNFHRIDLALYPSANLSIRVDSLFNLSSMAFALKGYNNNNNNKPSSYKFVDSQLPYSLGGNTPLGHYLPVNALTIPGEYTLTITPSGKGLAKSTARLYFDVLSAIRVENVTLFDATNRASLDSGTYLTIDRSEYQPNATLSIIAVTVGSVGSVAFNLTRYLGGNDSSILTVVDSDAPFSLDVVSSPHQHSVTPAFTDPGIYMLIATPFKGPNQEGDAGSSSVVYIEVVSDLRVTNFSLVDATTGAILETGPDLTSIDLARYPDNATFTIGVTTTSGVGSVEMNLTRYDPDSSSFVELFTIVDSSAPFTLDGNKVLNNNDAGEPFLSLPGTYKLTTTPFAGADGQGDVGSPRNAWFEVLSKFRVESLTLVDVASGSDIETFNDFDEIDLSQYNSIDSFTIRADVSPGVQSVEFNWTSDDGNFLDMSTVDSIFPFSLDGTSSPGQYTAVPELSVVNRMSVQVTPYREPDKHGIPGKSKYFSVNVLSKFRIGNVSLVEIGDDGTGTFLDGTYADLNEFGPNASFTIIAGTTGDIVRVRFNMTRYLDDGNTTSLIVNDNSPPFSLDGESITGNYVGVPQLSFPVVYLLAVTPFFGPDEQEGPTFTTDGQIVSRLRIADLALVDATTSEDIDTYFQRIDLSELPDDVSLTIRADVSSESIGSVEFKLTRYSDIDGEYDPTTTVAIVDNAAPFTLDGTSVLGQYNSSPALTTPGSYFLVVTPFAGTNRQGEKGVSRSVDFELIPAFQISNFTLVDIRSRKVLDEIFYDIDLSKYPLGARFSIVASTVGDVGCVEFVLSKFNANNTKHYQFSRVSNIAPFSLGGRKSSNSLKAVRALHTPGHYSLKATSYSGVNKTGRAGPSQGLEFRVLPPFKVTNFTVVNAATGKDIAISNSILVLNMFTNETTFTIRANTLGVIGSVYFELIRSDISTGNFTIVYSGVANTLPFALGPTTSNSSYSGVAALSVPGSYYVLMTPYSMSDKLGDEGETQYFELYVLVKPPVADSCEGFCGGYNPLSYCGCYNSCVRFGDCCNDYCKHCVPSNSTASCKKQK